ncbi:MAG TPA: hypothetical protein VL593_01345, partial [Ramlibacter sp.]|nr:hypothetical protein [Ramlibacter sp.]
VRDLLKLSAENFRFLQTVLSRYESSLKRVDVAQGHEAVAADLLADWEETHRPTLHSFSIMRQHNAQLSPAEFASAHKDSIGNRAGWRPLSLMMAALWAGTGASYHKLQSLNPEQPFQSDQPNFLNPSDADKAATGAFYACTIVGALLSLFLIIQFCATLSARVREGRQDMSVALSKNAEKATTRVNTAQSRVDEMEGFVVQELERVGGPADGPRLEEIIEFPRQAAGASSATSTYAGGAGLFGPLEDWSTKQTGEHEWEMRSDGKDPVTLDRAQLRLIRALRDGDVVSRTDLETALEDASANVEDRLNGMAQKFAALGVTLERPEEGSYRLQRSDA